MLLVSPQFLKKTPCAARILDIPIPIRTRTDDIVFPKSGFNKDLAVYVAPDDAVIRNAAGTGP